MHNLIKEFIHSNEPVSEALPLINEVLRGALPEGVVVTEEHISMCDSIVQDAVTVPLPFPNEQSSEDFSNQFDKKSAKDEQRTPGCYMIHSSDSDKKYVGQGVHVGSRVKEHSYGTQPNTKEFITSIKDTAVVTVFAIPEGFVFPVGFTLPVFLTVLEQYLFIVCKPTVNRFLVATPGVPQSPEALAKHAAKMNVKVYAYTIIDGVTKLLHVFVSTRAVGATLGLGKSFYSSIVARSGGWFRSEILFTQTLIDSAKEEVMSAEEFKEFFESVKGANPLTKKVIATNSITGEVTTYDSLKEAARVLGVKTPKFSKGQKMSIRGNYKFVLIK